MPLTFKMLVAYFILLVSWSTSAARVPRNIGLNFETNGPVHRKRSIAGNSRDGSRRYWWEGPNNPFDDIICDILTGQCEPSPKSHPLFSEFEPLEPRAPDHHRQPISPQLSRDPSRFPSLHPSEHDPRSSLSHPSGHSSRSPFSHPSGHPPRDQFSPRPGHSSRSPFSHPSEHASREPFLPQSDHRAREPFSPQPGHGSRSPFSPQLRHNIRSQVQPHTGHSSRAPFSPHQEHSPSSQFLPQPGHGFGSQISPHPGHGPISHISPHLEHAPNSQFLPQSGHVSRSPDSHNLRHPSGNQFSPHSGHSSRSPNPHQSEHPSRSQFLPQPGHTSRSQFSPQTGQDIGSHVLPQRDHHSIDSFSRQPVNNRQQHPSDRRRHPQIHSALDPQEHSVRAPSSPASAPVTSNQDSISVEEKGTMGQCQASYICLNWQLCNSEGFVISDGTAMIDDTKEILPEYLQGFTRCGPKSYCCQIDLRPQAHQPPQDADQSQSTPRQHHQTSQQQGAHQDPSNNAQEISPDEYSPNDQPQGIDQNAASQNDRRQKPQYTSPPRTSQINGHMTPHHLSSQNNQQQEKNRNTPPRIQDQPISDSSPQTMKTHSPNEQSPMVNGKHNSPKISPQNTNSDKGNTNSPNTHEQTSEHDRPIGNNAQMSNSPAKPNERQEQQKHTSPHDAPSTFNQNDKSAVPMTSKMNRPHQPSHQNKGHNSPKISPQNTISDKGNTNSPNTHEQTSEHDRPIGNNAQMSNSPAKPNERQEQQQHNSPHDAPSTFNQNDKSAVPMTSKMDRPHQPSHQNKGKDNTEIQHSSTIEAGQPKSPSNNSPHNSQNSGVPLPKLKNAVSEQPHQNTQQQGGLQDKSESAQQPNSPGEISTKDQSNTDQKDDPENNREQKPQHFSENPKQKTEGQKSPNKQNNPLNTGTTSDSTAPSNMNTKEDEYGVSIPEKPAARDSPIESPSHQNHSPVPSNEGVLSNGKKSHNILTDPFDDTFHVIHDAPIIPLGDDHDDDNKFLVLEPINSQEHSEPSRGVVVIPEDSNILLIPEEIPTSHITQNNRHPDRIAHGQHPNDFDKHVNPSNLERNFPLTSEQIPQDHGNPNKHDSLNHPSQNTHFDETSGSNIPFDRPIISLSHDNDDDKFLILEPLNSDGQSDPNTELIAIPEDSDILFVPEEFPGSHLLNDGHNPHSLSQPSSPTHSDTGFIDDPNRSNPNRPSDSSDRTQPDIKNENEHRRNDPTGNRKLNDPGRDTIPYKDIHNNPLNSLHTPNRVAVEVIEDRPIISNHDKDDLDDGFLVLEPIDSQGNPTPNGELVIVPEDSDILVVPDDRLITDLGINHDGPHDNSKVIDSSHPPSDFNRNSNPLNIDKQRPLSDHTSEPVVLLDGAPEIVISGDDDGDDKFLVLEPLDSHGNPTPSGELVVIPEDSNILIIPEEISHHNQDVPLGSHQINDRRPQHGNTQSNGPASQDFPLDDHHRSPQNDPRNSLHVPDNGNIDLVQDLPLIVAVDSDDLEDGFAVLAPINSQNDRPSSNRRGNTHQVPHNNRGSTNTRPQHDNKQSRNPSQQDLSHNKNHHSPHYDPRNSLHAPDNGKIEFVQDIPLIAVGDNDDLEDGFVVLEPINHDHERPLSNEPSNVHQQPHANRDSTNTKPHTHNKQSNDPSSQDFPLNENQHSPQSDPRNSFNAHNNRGVDFVQDIPLIIAGDNDDFEDGFVVLEPINSQNDRPSSNGFGNTHEGLRGSDNNPITGVNQNSHDPQSNLPSHSSPDFNNNINPSHLQNNGHHTSKQSPQEIGISPNNYERVNHPTENKALRDSAPHTTNNNRHSDQNHDRNKLRDFRGNPNIGHHEIHEINEPIISIGDNDDLDDGFIVLEPIDHPIPNNNRRPGQHHGHHPDSRAQNGFPQNPAHSCLSLLDPNFKQRSQDRPQYSNNREGNKPASTFRGQTDNTNVHRRLNNGNNPSTKGGQRQSKKIDGFHEPQIIPGVNAPPIVTPLGTSLIGNVCSGGVYCVRKEECNPYTGFIIMDRNQIAAVSPVQETVPLLSCFVPVTDQIQDGVCCQLPHPIAGSF